MASIIELLGQEKAEGFLSTLYQRGLYLKITNQNIEKFEEQMADSEDGDEPEGMDHWMNKGIDLQQEAEEVLIALADSVNEKLNPLENDDVKYLHQHLKDLE